MLLPLIPRPPWREPERQRHKENGILFPAPTVSFGVEMMKASEGISPRVRKELAALLAEGETLLASFEPNLDATLTYSQGLLVLTSRQLVSFEPGGHRFSQPVTEEAGKVARTARL